ncbi:MAG: hypothetical protein QM730_07155 [Anaerolineales bacterium]
MFSRKKDSEKAASQSPFALDILTTEYFMQGTAKGDQQFFIPSGTEYWYPIELSNVTLTTLSWQDVPVRTMDKFEVKGDAIVAMIPRKDPTGMMQYESYLAYKHAIQGTFYFGPYLFNGTLMSVGNNRFNSALVMLDVTIRHISPNSKLGEIKASHALVNTQWMHGREVK